VVSINFVLDLAIACLSTYEDISRIDVELKKRVAVVHLCGFCWVARRIIHRHLSYKHLVVNKFITHSPHSSLDDAANKATFFYIVFFNINL